MIRVAVLLLVLAAGPAVAQDQATNLTAFQQADALSFYAFDGCGDALAGRMYRSALMDRLAACPVTPEAQARFARWAALQQAKSRAALQQMIDAQGGLPMRLEGMDRTCHEQRASPQYQRLRALLERHANGEISAEAALPGPCDEPALMP